MTFAIRDITRTTRERGVIFRSQAAAQGLFQSVAGRGAKMIEEPSDVTALRGLTPDQWRSTYLSFDCPCAMQSYRS